jgi:Amt family ammonium transporter
MKKTLRSLLIVCAAMFLPAVAMAADAPAPDSGSTAWMLTSTAFVLLMVPGLAMFYGGLVRTKNVLGTMMHSFVAMGIITVVWVVCGYAMAFGPNIGEGLLGGWAGWSSNLFLLRGIDDTVTNGIPDLIFSMFQAKFAIITPALIAGAFAERVSFKSYCFFIALWSLLIYNPLCHWVWASDGFLFKMGAIDFAGGTVVHISAGVSGLVAAMFLGARKSFPHLPMRPNNLVMTLIGAGLLWVGWFGFNAGSSLSSGLAAAQALTATQVAAAAGAMAWVIIEAIHQGKATAIGFASGILAGLVAITPAAGVVQAGGALILGALATVICYLAIIVKNKLGYDDTLDAFGIHGVGGIVGAIVLTFFIRQSWITNWETANSATFSTMHQLIVQGAAVLIAISYAAIGTWLILFILNKIVPLRASAEAEMKGLDNTYHGERGYGMVNPN